MSGFNYLKVLLVEEEGKLLHGFQRPEPQLTRKEVQGDMFLNQKEERIL